MKVVIAIPTYTGQVHARTMQAIMVDVRTLWERGVPVQFMPVCNELIEDARAIAVARFIETDATDLIFVDADTAWERGALVRLLDYPVEFVAGVAPFRHEPYTDLGPVPMQFPVEFLNEPSQTRGGLIQVRNVGFGLVRLRRTVLERMIAAYLESEVDYMVTGGRPARRTWALFDRIDRRPEDFSFNKRWRDIGGKIYVDPELILSHTGSKTYTGRLGDWLRAYIPSLEKLVREREAA